MIIGYIRTSTEQQNTDRQLDGVACDKIYTDQISGSTIYRPELKRLMEYARKGDTVICHQIDRMARSLTDLLNIVETLVKKGVTVKFHKENLTFSGDSDDSVSVLMLHMLGAVAQFEKSIINSRVREGVRKAQELGKYKGRQRSIDEKTVQKILELVSQGVKKIEICKQLNLSRATIYRYLEDPINGKSKASKSQMFKNASS